MIDRTLSQAGRSRRRQLQALVYPAHVRTRLKRRTDADDGRDACAASRPSWGPKCVQKPDSLARRRLARAPQRAARDPATDSHPPPTWSDGSRETPVDSSLFLSATARRESRANSRESAPEFLATRPTDRKSTRLNSSHLVISY